MCYRLLFLLFFLILIESRVSAEQQGAISLKDYFNAKISQDQPTFIIQIIAWKRLFSLTRLLRSVENADYFGLKISLKFNIDGGGDQDVVDFASNYTWNIGPKHINRFEENRGLIKTITGAWSPDPYNNPNDRNEYSIFLEDDIRVSPLYFKWALLTLINSHYDLLAPVIDYNSIIELSSCRESRLSLVPKFANNTLSPDHIFGISFYNPNYDEVNWKKFNPTQVVGSYPLYLMQLPCSWGALYFPKQWYDFKLFMDQRVNNFSKCFPPLPGPAHSRKKNWVNKWFDSWKRFYIEFIVLHPMYMVTPSFKGFKSFSTNHMEAGVHASTKSNRYLVPLVSAFEDGVLGKHVPGWCRGKINLPFNEQPIVDVFHSLKTHPQIQEVAANFMEDVNKRCLYGNYTEEVTVAPAPELTIIIRKRHLVTLGGVSFVVIMTIAGGWYFWLSQKNV